MSRTPLGLAGLATVVLLVALGTAVAQKCTDADTKSIQQLGTCSNAVEVARQQYANGGSSEVNPHAKFCEALNQYHSCFCQQAALCGDNEAGARAIETQMRNTLTADGGACTNDGRGKLEAGSPQFCKPILSVVCGSQGCNANLFGSGLSPTCAGALDKQFSNPGDESLHPTNFKTALQGLQGLKRQTNFVSNDKVIEDGGIYVPECSQPTDFFACVSKADALDAQPTPAPGPGQTTSVAQKVVYCRDEDSLKTDDAESYKRVAHRIVNNVCQQNGNQFEPIAQQFGGPLNNADDRQLGRCCDRPLKPGTCDRSVKPDSRQNEVQTRCAKRWVGGSIQRFKKACESVKDGEGTPYGTAYFLSARAEKLVGSIKNIYEIVDGNVLCWPRTQCIAGDLQKHLESRAAECTANFMDECTYTARPIECNEPSSSDVANPDNANCESNLEEQTDAIGYPNLVEKWGKGAFGYTKCDNIMEKDPLDNKFTDTCTIRLSNGVVRGTASDAARTAPGALALVAAALVLRRNV